MAKELTIQEQRELLANPAYLATQIFETQQRMAKMYTTSSIVPDTYRNNIGNCVIAIDMAQRMQANPLMVMQNLYIVYGNPSWSSKFLISCINSCGRFSPLRYEFKGKEGGKDWACRAFAFEKNDTNHQEPLYGDWITMQMAEKEGWTSKQGSKWMTMPGQMLRYRAAAFWQRVYAPEISMGFYTKEEVEDGAIGSVDDVAEENNDSVNLKLVDAEPDSYKPVDHASFIKASMQKQQQEQTQETPAVDAETGELFTDNQ
jgi:hypothetical protein